MISGSNKSSMKVNSLSTTEMDNAERSLMSLAEKIWKDKRFNSGTNMEEPTRDGRSSILTRVRFLNRPRVLIQTVDSISTEHSISDQDSQCRESLKLLVIGQFN